MKYVVLFLAIVLALMPSSVGGASYNRVLVRAAYSSCGVYYPATYRYEKIVAVLPAVAPLDWRARLLKIKAAQVEQQAYVESINLLGLGRGYQSNSYQLSAYGGNTQYGISQYSQLYGTMDLNALQQAAYRTTENAQSYADRAAEQHLGLVGSVNAGAARVAEINANAQATVAFLQNLSKSSVTVETKQFGSVPNNPSLPGQSLKKVQPPMPLAEEDDPLPANSTLPQLGALIKSDCMGCHAQTNKDRPGAIKVDLEAWPSFTTDQKVAVWQRLITNDPAKKMPRDKDGKGIELSAEKKKLFFSN